MERKGTVEKGQPFPLPLPLAALARRLAISVLIANLLVLLAVGLLLRQSLFQYENEASVLTRSIAGILDANLSGIIAKVDIALLAVTDEAERQLARGPIDAASFNRFIVREHARIPEAESFRAADATGLAIYGPEVPVAKTKSLAHRDYFKYLHDKRETALVFSDPLIGGISGKWMILFVRRISAPDGGFAGLAYVGVTLEYLTTAFSAFDVGRFGMIELRDRNLKLVSRFPMRGDPGVAMTEDRVDPPLVGLAATGKPEGQYFVGGGSSGQKYRIVSYRRVGTHPFLVGVSLVREEYLARWYKSVWTLSFIALAIALVSIFIAILFYRNSRRNRLAAGQLFDQEEKFRTVADYTYEWEFWLGPKGDFLYVSPSCRRVTGYEAADFYGDPSFFERILHPDDLATYREHVNSVHKDKGFSVFSFRVIRADGEERWIEHLCQPVTSASGAYLGTRGSNRDITERRLADLRIQGLLAEKELLLSEVHHRIKNNMTVITSLLELQANTDEETSARKILQTASNRVRSMTLLYEKLYLSRNFSSLSIREYFTPLLTEIHGTFPGHEKVELDLDFADLVLDADKLSRIGIILNELVTNSMKHAFRNQDGGRISIGAVLVGNRVVVTFRDDGAGLSGEAGLKKQAHFGLGMVELLVHQLDGKSSIDRERGFSFRMEFDR